MNFFKNPQNVLIPQLWWMLIKEELKRRPIETEVILDIDTSEVPLQTVKTMRVNEGIQNFTILCSIRDKEDIPSLVHELCHVWQFLRDIERTHLVTELEADAVKWEKHYANLPFDEIPLLKVPTFVAILPRGH